VILDKTAILAAPDRRRETVDVPEWGEGAQVILQEMSALDRDRFNTERQIEFVDGPPGKDGKPTQVPKMGTDAMVNYAARVLVRCIVDEEGKRIFTDDDAEMLGGKSTKVLQRLFKVVAELNKLDGPTQGDVKNSEPGLSESSLSD
jgi:hypothetical protein